jgi:hyperosmotically inducible periplasmic protein
MRKIKILMMALFLGMASVSFVTPTLAAETTGQYVKNSAVTTAVKADLLANSDVKSLHIKVKTIKHGVVVLSGYVDTEDQKQKAASIAGSSKGVTEVMNKLKVKAPKKS